MPAPSTPSILVRPGAYDGYLQFFWYNQGDSTIQYYTIDCSNVYGDSITSPFNNSGMRYPAGLLTYKMDPGYLTNGVKYTFTLTATNSNGEVSQPATFRTVAPGLKPQPVTSVSATYLTSDSALVTWVSSGTVAVPPVEWFVAQAISCNVADPLIQRSQYPYNSNVVLSSLNAASQYIFKVYAVNDPGYSPVTTTPGPPTGVSGTSGNTQVTVAWTPPFSDGGAAITSYTVKYSTDGSTYTAFGTTFSSSPGIVTGLTKGTAYTFKVSATNANGNSADSTASAPVAPQFMVWNPATRGTDVVIGNSGLSVSQQFGYRQTALATRMVTTGERVLYSIQPAQIGPFQTMTVGWGTSTMHYNGTSNAYTGYPGTDDQSVGVDFYGSSFYNSTAQVTQLPVYSTVGDVVDMALHDGVGWWIRVNGGLWNNDSNANPATDAGGLSVQGLTALFPAANPAGGGRADGALLLLETSTYTVPSGYTFI